MDIWINRSFQRISVVDPLFFATMAICRYRIIPAMTNSVVR
jgi:hypothetical protein